MPMIYAMLPDKSGETYVRFFEEIKNRIVKSPTQFTHDFEKGALNAIEACFAGVSINSCYFHYAQCLWKNMLKHKLPRSYGKNPAIHHAFMSLECLAFLPVSDVIHDFKTISASAPTTFAPMLVYFEKNFVGRLDKRDTRAKRRVIPVYPIRMWNVRERVLAHEPRTNNSIEAWHKAFAADICNHPTYAKLIEAFRVEQRSIGVLYAQLRKGDIYPRKKESIEKDKLLELEY